MQAASVLQIFLGIVSGVLDVAFCIMGGILDVVSRVVDFFADALGGTIVMPLAGRDSESKGECEKQGA